jgi:phospholipid-binding lipoprotein MlaA
MTIAKTALRLALGAAMMAGFLLLQGCSTLGKSPGDRLDPWENWNRKVFNFNEGLDTHVLKPVATVYSNIVPGPIRRSIDNFFGNAADAWSAVNNFLQGKVANGLHDVIRFGTNTVFGLGGFLDVATEFGLDHQYEDFGQTLGTWGVKSGPYIVWPVLGPSSVRESFAMPLDLSASPAWVFDGGGYKFGISSLQLVNKRANLLGATGVIDDIALDKYTFVRDAYLQRRRSLVFDGNVPEDPEPPDANAPAGAASAAASASGAKPANTDSQKPADEKPADEKAPAEPAPKAP